MANQKRNDLCSCGSGKKVKKYHPDSIMRKGTIFRFHPKQNVILTRGGKMVKCTVVSQNNERIFFKEEKSGVTFDVPQRDLNLVSGGSKD
jgi:hypothetical protein